MCGIVGITSTKKVSSTILNSLRKLEYRGYDSAGIATLESGLIKEVIISKVEDASLPATLIFSNFSE